MNMPTLSGAIVRPLGHKSRHQIISLCPHFGKSFKQGGLIGGGSSFIYGDGGLPHTRTRFGVEAFDGKVHHLAQLQ